METTNKPIRIQRKRVKGWCKPDNTVHIGRPSKYGNPFKVGEEAPDVLYDMYDLPDVKSYDDYPSYLDTQTELKYLDRGHTIENNEIAVELFEEYILWLEDKYPDKYKALVEPLKGRNLMCWCKENEPCHGDILLKYANE